MSRGKRPEQQQGISGPSFAPPPPPRDGSSRAQPPPVPELLAQARLAEDYRAVWSTPAGHRVLSDLMWWANVYSQIRTNDPIELGILTGERNTALRIVELLNFRPQEYVQRARESADTLNSMTSAEAWLK